MGSKGTTSSRKESLYLVLWWMNKTPFAAVFTNRIAADAAANVRNALLVSITGSDVEIDEVVDWYRRDEEGHPMPAEWRELLGQVHVPWSSRSTSLAESAEIA